MLLVNEIYQSIQGESTFAGLPCVFVRLTLCNLRCSYCDTAYAFHEGSRLSVEEVVKQVLAFETSLVELTGGEPLVQPESIPLMKLFCDAGKTVLLETSGSLDISKVDPRVRKIMDLKAPSSGEAERNRFENIQHLLPHDEVKFVLASREDYEWAKAQIQKFELPAKCTVLFSWVHPLREDQKTGGLKPAPKGHHFCSKADLVQWILQDKLPVRFQLQMHKYIWDPAARSV